MPSLNPCVFSKYRFGDSWKEPELGWWWFPGARSGMITPTREISLSIDGPTKIHALHYADCVLEGIRRRPVGPAVADALGYSGDGYLIFRLKDHIERIFQSAAMYRIAPLPFNHRDLTEGCMLIAQFNEDAHYLRPAIFQGKGLGIAPPPEAGAIVVSEPWGRYLKLTYNDGIKLRLSDWCRPGSNNVPPFAKGAANYVTSKLAKLEALDLGFSESLLLAPNEEDISEATGMNIYLVIDGKLVTPSRESSRLDGITRRTIAEIAHHFLGVETVERSVDWSELPGADEILLCGTASEVAPVTYLGLESRSLPDQTVGNGFAGPLTVEIARLLGDVAHGRKIYKPEWLTWVPRR